MPRRRVVVVAAVTYTARRGLASAAADSPPLIEQHIGGLGANTLFVGGGDAAVVEVVPPVVDAVLRVCGVMASAHSAKMVRDAYEIVGGPTARRVQNVV